MTLSLEQRIKELMEAKEDLNLLSESSIEELEEAKIKVNKDGTIVAESDPDAKAEDDEDEDEDVSDEKQDDTDAAKDTGKKDKAEVKEAADPFGSLASNGSDEAGSDKTNKLKSGLSRKDDAGQGKLDATLTTDETDDNGDNARLKAKQGIGDKIAGKLSGTPEADGDNNPENAKNAVNSNPQSVKEHMAALFNGEELSEEFQTKAATIFEAAVEQVAQSRIEALTEEYAQKVVQLQEEIQIEVNEAMKEVRSELVENIDDFLNVIVEQWTVDNQVALESGMKVELVNSFIDGMKNLFKEHYVELPEEKLDIVDEQLKELNALSQTTGELIEVNEALNSELISLKSELIFEAVSDGLTNVQVEKFKSLVENVEFTTNDEYTNKLETIKENYFPNGQTVKNKDVAAATTDETMSAYVSAVTQNLRFR